jgi:dGTPase
MSYLRNREELERLENLTLAPYALKSIASRGRDFPEKESGTRTAFQRDRDRIIHTTAFRRLEYKTQVFVFYEGDHYRTRLTHTLEVTQLGRSIARRLGANEDLVEAICLAHDLGHPPFGHSGEQALNELMKDHGGFNHNTQSYRVVTELEDRYRNFMGLNLTYETREGMIKHETEYDQSDVAEYEPEKRASLEAQIANLADEIAYNAHDLEDGLRAALFGPSDLEELEIWQTLKNLLGWDGQKFGPIILHEIIRELIGLMVGDVVEMTASNINAAGIIDAEQMQLQSANVVHYSSALAGQVRDLKDFLYQRMYRHYRLLRMQSKAERFISEIFEAYVREPRMLPVKAQKSLSQAPPHRVVADYIAGMTDRYALEEWEKLFDPYRKA